MHVQHRPLFLPETKPPFPPLSDLSLTSNQVVVYCSIGKGVGNAISFVNQPAGKNGLGT